MTITEEKNEANANLILAISGRLDTTTAPELEAKLKDCPKGLKALFLDMKDVEYISSAGLRVLLSAQKVMNSQGSMVIKNASDDIKEIFDVTGFTDILNIE